MSFAERDEDTITQSIALHTRLKPGRELDYEALHAVIPEDLAAAIRAAGATSWRIWRSGQDLFHLIECTNYSRLQSTMANHPVNLEWQATVGPLLDKEFTYEADQGLTLVWALP